MGAREHVKAHAVLCRFILKTKCKTNTDTNIILLNPKNKTAKHTNVLCISKCIVCVFLRTEALLRSLKWMLSLEHRLSNAQLTIWARLRFSAKLTSTNITKQGQEANTEDTPGHNQGGLG